MQATSAILKIKFWSPKAIPNYLFLYLFHSKLPFPLPVSFQTTFSFTCFIPNYLFLYLFLCLQHLFLLPLLFLASQLLCSAFTSLGFFLLLPLHASYQVLGVFITALQQVLETLKALCLVLFLQVTPLLILIRADTFNEEQPMLRRSVIAILSRPLCSHLPYINQPIQKFGLIMPLCNRMTLEVEVSSSSHDFECR